MKRTVYLDFVGIPVVLVMLLAVIPSANARVRIGGINRATRPPAAARNAIPALNLLKLPGIEAFALAAPLATVTTTNLFAQVALGGGYTTIFSFANTGATAVTGNLILTDSQGLPMQTAFSSPGTAITFGSSYPISIPTGGLQEVIAAAIDPINNPTIAGWARVESSGGVLGGVATFQYAPGGALSVIVGVLSADATSVATIPVDDDHLADVNTGYAIANIGNTPINVKLVFIHPDGTTHSTLTPPGLNPLPAQGHVATFLWQDANDSFFLFRGTVVMIEQSGKPFSVVALVLNKGLLTAVPVIPSKAPGIL
jgi:hypothetical protein